MQTKYLSASKQLERDKLHIVYLECIFKIV